MAQLPSSAGASNTLFQHERPNSVNRSRFDLSRITNFTADAGMIIPFDVIPTLPGDDFDINFKMVMDTLPLVNASLTSYKVTTHWYYVKNRDCWKGWNTFITKGRSGNVSLSIPRVDLEFGFSGDDDYEVDISSGSINCKVLPIGSHSLSSFLGVPSRANGGWDYNDDADVLNINSQYLPYVIYPIENTPIGNRIRKTLDTGFNQYRFPSALPFMAYQNIVKWNYVNQNWLDECSALFPVEGDDDWMLPYNANVTNYVMHPSNTLPEGIEDNASFSGVFFKDDAVVRLDCLRYAMFDDDYFTTGLPWLQRGDVSTLSMDDIDLTGISASLSGSDYSDLLMIKDSDIRHITASNTTAGSALSVHVNPSPAAADSVYNGRVSVSDIASRMAISIAGSASASFGLTANMLRELLALSVWQERNARVNGSYNMMIYQHWRQNPHSEEHKPVYIGGTVDNVTFTNILQNSASTSDSPLGSTAGRATAGGSSYVGKFHSDDYGMIFGIMIVKPNTTYMQGVEHFLSCENVFDDFVQPEFESLSPQPILNKELYISDDDEWNNALLCYQERYTYLKVRQNVNRGLFVSAPDKNRDFSSMTQARWFSSKPKMSYQFLCMSPRNLRRDFLAYPSLPAFRFQTASQVYVTRALSYTSQPNTFGF